jgi:hypothetical protein
MASENKKSPPVSSPAGLLRVAGLTAGDVSATLTPTPSPCLLANKCVDARPRLPDRDACGRLKSPRCSSRLVSIAFHVPKLLEAAAAPGPYWTKRMTG